MCRAQCLEKEEQVLRVRKQGTELLERFTVSFLSRCMGTESGQPLVLQDCTVTMLHLLCASVSISVWLSVDWSWQGLSLQKSGRSEL